MKIAIRHILVTLAWVGLLLGHRALAAMTGQLRRNRSARHDVQARGRVRQRRNVRRTLPVRRQHARTAARRWWANIKCRLAACSATRRRRPANSAVAETACRRRGPSTDSVAVIGHVACQQSTLGTNSLPAGPLIAGSVIVTNSGHPNPGNCYSVLERRGSDLGFGSPHAESDRQPRVGLTISRFLGRDGEETGPLPRIRLQRSGELHAIGRHGPRVHHPVLRHDAFSTKPFPPHRANAWYFQGSLVSPFPIYLPLNGNQQQLISPVILDTRPELRPGIQSIRYDVDKLCHHLQ